MKIETHIKNSLKKCGVEGRDIHEWIDAHFEHGKFNNFLQTGVLPDSWNPYEHRIHRHCIEAVESCLFEFKNRYSAKDIKAVFKSHLIDDYRGYLPKRKDFSEKEFHDKYHQF